MPNASLDPSYLNLPVSGIRIGSNDYNLTVRECNITRTMNEHDSAKLSVVLSGTLTFDGKLQVAVDATDPTISTRTIEVEQLVDQPIRFVYGRSPNAEAFVGFITTITPNQKFKQGIEFDIEALGATSVMQQVVRRFDARRDTEELRLFHLIKRRTEASFVSLFCDYHDYNWTSVGQTTFTDWEYIVGLATTVGYAVFSWGPVVRVCDPVRLMSSAPYKVLVASDNVLDSTRSLMDFYPTENSKASYQYQGIEALYFDSSGAVRDDRAGTNASVWQPLDVPIVDEAHAAALLKGAELSIDRWRQQATAHIKGDGGIIPGMVVTIDSGRNSTTARFNGRWLVTGVQHSMTRTAFDTNLDLARPVPAPGAAQQYRPFWAEFGVPQPVVSFRNGGPYGRYWATQYSSLEKGKP